MKDTERELYREVLSSWGISDQMNMAIEECSELTNAICKLRRGRITEKEVITEIADVMIMCEQLSVYFGESCVNAEREYKITRLKKRLKEWRKSKGLL